MADAATDGAEVAQQSVSGTARASDGIWRRLQAAEAHAFADMQKARTPEAARERADRLDIEADTLLDVASQTGERVSVGIGGEATAIKTEPRLYRDTLLERPDMVAVDASRHRLALAHMAGGLAMALDAAETIQAANSIERMLAHQAAAAHIAAMRLQVESLALIDEFVKTDRRYAILTTEAVKLMHASAQMMQVTQGCASTLHRLRNSNRQTIVVQRVNVDVGAQAVAVGQAKSRRRNKRTSQRG